MKAWRLRTLRVSACLTVPWAACSHQVESPAPKLTSLEPALICSAQWPSEGLVVGINGSEFTPLPVDTLEEPVSIELPEVQLVHAQSLDESVATGEETLFSGVTGQSNAERLSWQSSSRLEITLSDGIALTAGLYDLTVTNPDELSAVTRASALAVVDPPSLLSVEPTALCNTLIDQPLRLRGSNFVEADGVAPTVRLTSAEGDEQSFAVAALEDCREIDGEFPLLQICETAVITIPASSLAQSKYSIVVENPISAGCGSTETVELDVINDGPVLFYADPPVAYNGINTQVTLFLTDVAEPFDVKIVPAGEIAPESELSAAVVSGTSNRLQAVVPETQSTGTFDVVVNDASGCETRLESGLVVTSDLSITLASVTDPFGDTNQATSVTIFRDSGTEFTATPRVFLNPVEGGAGGDAIQLESVTLASADALTAIVPAGAPVGRYDLVVVNPSGEVGLLSDAYESAAVAPPVIDDVQPQSIVNQTLIDGAEQDLTITGTGFSGATALARCESAGNASLAPSVTVVTESCVGTACTLAATIDGGDLSPGDVCVIRVTNADGTYGEFSAVGATNSSYNLSDPRAGQSLLEARRGLVSAAAKATSAARFVYAIGGDGGDATMPFGSVEFAPVSVFGAMSDFVASPEPLQTPRTMSGGTQIGRYVYVVGGDDGSGAIATAERALVLSPEESPRIEDLDLCLSGSEEPCYGDSSLGEGLGVGDYAYRVSAVIDAADLENLGGETLASDPLPLRLPDVVGRAIVPQITWSPPLDPLGEVLSGIVGWRVYRTPTDGVVGKDEVLLAELTDPAARTFVDDGSQTLATTPPLPLGATSAWQSLPDLAVARTGLSAAAIEDPADPTTWHVYALLGEGQADYEFLDVSVLPNGRQTVAATWVAGTEQSAVARSEFGVWVVDDLVSETVTPGEVYLFLGAGLAGGGDDGRVEAALVAPGGQLGAFADDPAPGDLARDFSSTRVGYGTAAAAGRLFVFGGLAGAGVRGDATAAELIDAAPELRNNAWSNEGLNMTESRYLAGSAVQSAFIFLIGGQTDAAGTVTNTTELVVW